MVNGQFWDPDYRALVDALEQQPVRDLSRPDVVAALRDPGPPPPASDGVSWTETTLPNQSGDHQIPVRIYQPEKPDARRPGYVLFHGGGLSFGHLNTEHQRCVELTRSCGAVGVSVDFRMAPEHPAEVILDDAYSALRHVALHAESFAIDPRRIAITGSSGGGLLTLSIAQLARDRAEVAPMLAIAFYPNTDNRALPRYTSRHTSYPVISAVQVDQVMRNLAPTEPPARYALANRTDDLEGLCATFIVQGQNDPLRDEAVDYAWRLMRADVPTELHVLPGVPHGFDGLAPTAAATKRAYELMNEAFRAAAERV